MQKTPRQLGFHMPPEWAPHEGTWLAWPYDPHTFPRKIIRGVETIYLRMITELSKGEKVHLLITKKDMARVKRGLIAKNAVLKNIEMLSLSYLDVWIRDWGPTFLMNKKTGALGCTKWVFNAWGNKWPDLLPDNAAGQHVARASGAHIFHPGIVMEGGSIENNGGGCLLVTQQCQLNKNRNPQLSSTQIENVLKEYLTVKKIIWLKNGIEGDDTDGHIDDIARFVNESTIFCAYEQKSRDPNHKILAKNWRILKKARDTNGRPFTLIKLPMPKARLASTVGPHIPGADPNRRLAASYSNFYIGNACVLVPLYDKRYDNQVLALFAKYFPGRKIVGIPCTKLVFGFGSIHCVTQQQPK